MTNSRTCLIDRHTHLCSWRRSGSERCHTGLILEMARHKPTIIPRDWGTELREANPSWVFAGQPISKAFQKKPRTRPIGALVNVRRSSFFFEEYLTSLNDWIIYQLEGVRKLRPRKTMVWIYFTAPQILLNLLRLYASKEWVSWNMLLKVDRFTFPYIKMLITAKAAS